MKKIGRSLLMKCIGDVDAIKALALLVFVKNKYPCSVIPEYTDTKLAQVCGLSRATVKSRIAKLRSMGLVYDVVNKKEQHHLGFKAASEEFNNIKFAFGVTDIKSIEIGLEALFIVEKQGQKDYARQQVLKVTSPGKLSSYKKARTECLKRGWVDISDSGQYINKFQDNGISYNYLARKLNRGRSHIATVIKFAEENNMLAVDSVTISHDLTSNSLIIGSKMPKGTFIRGNKIYTVLPNRFVLPSNPRFEEVKLKSTLSKESKRVWKERKMSSRKFQETVNRYNAKFNSEIM